MVGDDALGDGQSQAAATGGSGRVGTVEPAEDAPALLPGQLPGIGDGQQGAAPLPGQFHPDGGVFRGVAQGVVQEDGQYLPEVPLAAADVQTLLELTFQGQTALEIQRLKGQQLVGDQGREVQHPEGRPDGTVVHPGQLQQALHQLAHPAAHGQDAPGMLGVRVRLHQLGAGQDHGQGGLQFVAGVGYELPLLLPGPFHGPDRPPGQQEADRPEKAQGQQPDAGAGQPQVPHGGPLGGDVHEDQSQLRGGLAPEIAQVILVQDPQRLRCRGRQGHDVREHLFVAEIEAAGGLDALAPGVGPDDEAGLPDLARRAGLQGIGGSGAQEADALGLEVLAGEMDHEAEDHAKQRGKNRHGHGDEFAAQGTDQCSSTSR